MLPEVWVGRRNLPGHLLGHRDEIPAAGSGVAGNPRSPPPSPSRIDRPLGRPPHLLHRGPPGTKFLITGEPVGVALGSADGLAVDLLAKHRPEAATAGDGEQAHLPITGPPLEEAQ